MQHHVLINKRGFTLIETIISMAILGSVITFIYSFFLFENKIFASSNKQYNIQSDVRLGIDYITKEVRYATDLMIMPVATCESEILSNKPYSYIYVKNGSVHLAIYNSTTNTYRNTTIARVISNTGTAFSRVNDYTLSITLAGVNGTNNYLVHSSIVLNNFAIINPTQVIQGVSDLAIRYSSTPATSVGTLVETITVNGNDNYISTPNGTLQMVSTVSPVNAANKTVTWSVSDTSIATINASGLITAVNNGTVTATATANDGSNVAGTKIITISNQQIMVSSITVTGNVTKISTNNTLQMLLTIGPSNATNKSVTWSITSFNGKASIDQNGLLSSGKKSDQATITATAKDGSGKSGSVIITIN